MSLGSDDEALLDQFRRWLQDARAEPEAEMGEPAPDPLAAGDELPEVGLYRLAEEFTALRHEVKLQTKGARGLQEQAEALLTGLRQAIDQFRAVEPREAQAAARAGRPLAEALAELDEALERGRLEIEKARQRLVDAPAQSQALEAGLEALAARQPWYRRRWLRAHHAEALDLVRRHGSEGRLALFDAFREGYDLIQARLRRTLAAEQVLRIDCAGRPVDPERMTVVAVVDAPGQPPGLVIDEVRPGYTWRGQVLRFAEVRATRMPAPPPPAEVGNGTPDALQS